MELKQAIDKAIQDFGSEILKEKRLISILSDYQAFEDMPYAKNMLNSLYKNGDGERLYLARTTNDNSMLNNIAYNIVNKEGYAEDKTRNVLMSFALQGYQEVAYTQIEQPVPPQYQQTPPPYFKPQIEQPVSPRYQQPPTPYIAPQIVQQYTNNNYSVNSPSYSLSDPTDKKYMSKEAKILFSVIAIIYDIIAYFVGWGWLFLSVPLTAYYIMILSSDPPKKQGVYFFAAVTAIMLTVFLPIPWWSILIAIAVSFVGCFFVTDDD
ncbi:MAG: hypothetical protein J6T70_17205 [Bacteroidales bacterium]|nr:hypothetical protein [Bacteroidales bacterium]